MPRRRAASSTERQDESKTLHFPGFSKEACAFLLEDREVAGLAVDTLSLDFGASKDFAAHKLWLGAGKWGLECVANLAGLPQAPADYDPFGTPDQLRAATQRWRQVLDGVVAVGDMTSFQADALYRGNFVAQMVAAHKADLRAAQSVGMRAAFIERPEKGLGGGADLLPDPLADVQASDFMNLADKLCC